MARAARKPEIRWTIYRDYYSERGDNMIEPWVVLYGNEAEAKECMDRLNAGGDLSYFNPADEDQGFLYVDQLTI
jgi:hypothetical protein